MEFPAGVIKGYFQRQSLQESRAENPGHSEEEVAFCRGKVISQRRRTVIWCLQNYVVATSLRNVIVTKT